MRLIYLFLCLMMTTNVFSKANSCNEKTTTGSYSPQFIPPVADFSTTGSCINELVTLSDLSTNTPTSWTWTIPPSATFQNGTDANSQNPQVIFSSSGTYNITLDAANLDGNNSITKSIYVYDSSITLIDETFSAGVPPSGWLIINPDASEGWELTTTTGIDGNPTQVARMDNYQYNAPGQLDELVLPSLDLTTMTNPKLYFDVAYARYGPSNFERLHVEYSTDCGANFNATGYDKQSDVLATVGDQASGWGPSDASHWRSEVVDLTAYKSSGTILKFIQTAGYGNGLFIDNVRIGTDDPPNPDFTYSPDCVLLGETIAFTDTSLDFPASWSWSFSPASVTFVNGTNANSQNPEVQFNAVANYTVTLTATNAMGSNSISKDIGLYGMETVPYTQDFSTGVPPAEWFIVNSDASEGWELTTTTGIDGNPTQVARMDNYQYNAPGQLDELVMPSVDLTTMTNPKLYFDVAYARYGPSNFERLHVEYSTDCGANFNATTYDKQSDVLATIGDQTSGWGPSDASHWRSEVVDLTAYKSSETILKFIQTAGYGNGLFIDNVRIGTDDPPAPDFTYSPDCVSLGTTVTFTDNSLDFPASWSWSFSPASVTFMNGTNANSQNPEVQFNAVANYTVTLTATNAMGSNSISKDISLYGMETVPYTQDFSAGVPPAEWFIVNSDASEGWELTTTTGIDGNPTQVARMDNYQYNAPGQLDELVMPSVDLTTMTNPKLYFDVAYARYGPSNFERLHVEYSTDCGANFNATTYDKQSDILATIGDQTSGWGPSDASHWRSEVVDLTAYKSSETILKFIQTAGYGNGLFIDNVRIGTDDPPAPDFTHSPDCSLPNTTAIFTDTSLDFPTSWSWSFSPTSVTFLNGTNANSQNPEVQFNTISNYTVTLTATNAAGFNSISKNIGSYGTGAAPYFEGFAAGVPPSEWFIVNPDASEGWELTSTTGIDGNPTQVTRMDNYQYNAPGQLDELVMPNVDISAMTNPKLYFDVAYARYGPSNFERLHVEYSTDCGANFNATGYDKQSDILATIGDQTSGWGPSDASHWRTDSIDLSGYVGASPIILKFIQTAGYGNGLFIDNIRIGESIDLPVELIYFEGEVVDCEIQLNWVSASEENFNYYEIQRSHDGINFSTIGRIESEEGITEQAYEYIDEKASKHNYYRLKMVDIDESYEYSKTIFIEQSCDNDQEDIRLYPNPIGQHKSLQIEFYSTSELTEILCMNIQGIIVKRLMSNTTMGWNNITLDIGGLPKGTYYIQIGSYSKMLTIID